MIVDNAPFPLLFIWCIAMVVLLIWGFGRIADEERREETDKEARRHAQDVAAEAFVEHQLLQKLLFELRHDPFMASKVEELLPCLRFADWRYAATHPGISFIPLEMTAEQMLQRKTF